MITNQDNSANDKAFRHRQEKGGDKYIVLRNILNIIFMVVALIGIIVYFYGNQNTGTIIILIAMAFKIVECVFRFMK